MRMPAVFAFALLAACGAKNAGQDGSIGAGDGGSGSVVTDAGLPAGGGDWSQYRHDERGGSENPGVFAAAEAGKLAQLWSLELGQYVYTQAVLSGDLAVYTTAFSGRVVAVDANTGAVRWSRTLKSKTCKSRSATTAIG